MKKRSGFVSNSSSSSFVIIGNKSLQVANKNYQNAFILEGKNLELFLLTMSNSQLSEEEQKEIKTIVRNGEKIGLTRYLGDHSSFEEHFGLDDEYGFGYCQILDEKPRDSISHFEYQCGNHGGPYSEEYYIEVAQDIFILKDVYNEDT
jgi:hypothetical protein